MGGILRPGVRSLPPGTERYLVKGGGSIVIDLEAGDNLRLIDLEGRQNCELVAFDPKGRCRSEMLGRAASGAAKGAQSLLSGAGQARAEALASKGCSLEGLRSLDLFGPESRAGAEDRMTAEAGMTLLVAAPGGPMAVDAQDPPSDIELFVERARPVDRAATRPLPDPLADPRLDLRIDRATASAFEVSTGQWIEITDVEGRQCSDLQAFRTDMLERGIERCLDVTTTRTLMGQGYPGPGLMSKYYDQDMEPLVEIVQDTCRRHDAFGLACAAKYYDDMGYPGHVNCSENFNGALEPFGVAPRAGWMAMNFFYNTGIDDHNQFYLDEPWSRPGDRILLRALTDLVCVSSACPDDISIANGWTPTDIHVRVYEAGERFGRSIGFRKNTRAEAEMTKETGFHPRTSSLTRDFVEYNGFWLPNAYTNHGAIDEYWACREKAIAMDLSALRKFEILGPDAETLMQRCLTRNVRKLAVGQVVYSAVCYDTGTMLDDGTLFRLGDNNFRWIGGTDYGGEWFRKQAAEMGLDVWVKSSTDQLHNLSLQGPASREILKDVIWTPPAQASIEELGWFRFSIGRLGGHQGIPVIVSRTGYTGELGYEVWCHPKHGPEVWDALWSAGEPHGLMPLGLEALDMLRIEAGLIFAGHEFDDQTDPYEAGIGFAVALKSKNEDFIGRAALEKRKENPQRRLVGLELEGNEPAAHGDCVHVEHLQVGVVTSATRSPILKKNIALCRLAIDYAEPGSEVEVGKLDGHQKRLPARVVPIPFYDPEKKRVRA
jgi:aminomethyltransferase